MKGQAAMEFLLTYGWAILIVIIMVSGLAYLGILSPSMFTPDKCFFGAGIGCVDHVVIEDSGSLSGVIILTNNFGNPISAKSVNISDLGTNASCACTNPGCDVVGFWDVAETKRMNITCANSVNSVNLKVRIMYKYMDGKYDRIVEGRVQSSVVK